MAPPPQAAPAALHCPVCQFPFAADPPSGTRCVECGWLLAGGFRAGGVSESRRDAFERELSAARQGADTYAAMIAYQASLVDGQPLDFAELVNLIREGPPEEAVLSQVVHQVADRFAAADGQGRDTVVELLTELSTADGPAAAIAFVQLSLSGVTIRRSTVRDVPLLVDVEVWSADWAELIDGLGPDPEHDIDADTEAEILRAFRMVGGVPVRTVENLAMNLDGVSRAEVDEMLADRLPDLSGHTVVVIHRLLDHGLVAQVATFLRRVYHTATEMVLTRRGGMPDVIDGTIADVPLARDVGMVLTEVGADGTVGTVAVPLFGKGETGCPEQSVQAYVSPDPGPRVLFPFATLEGDQVLGRPLGVVAVPVPTPPAGSADRLAPDGIRVSVRLGANRDVTMLAPESTPVDRDLTDVLDSVPAQLVRPPGLDLALAVDLCGSQEQVTARLRLLTDVLDRAADVRPAGLRVAVVGYTDHAMTEWQLRRRRYLYPVGFATADRVLAEVRGWARSPEWEHGHVAPVEDALHALADLGWRTDTDRAVLVLGGRPPCEVHAGLISPTCPLRLSWRDGLRRLARPGTRFVAVVDPPTWAPPTVSGSRLATRSAEHWQEIGADLCISPAQAQPDVLQDALRLAPVGAQRPLELALAHPYPAR